MKEKLGNELTKKQYFAIAAVTISLLMWSLPYITQTFYEQFLEAYDLTNTQAGFLITVFGLMATPCYIIGGIVADKFRAKKLVLLSLIITIADGIAMGFVKSYTGLIVIYIIYGLAMPLLQWSAYLKLVRAQGTTDQQGRIFGFFEVVAAVVSLAVNYGLLAILGNIVDSIGFQWVPSIYSIFLAIAFVLILVIVKEPESITKSNEFKLKYVGDVVKEPAVWINAVIVMCLFASNACLTYLNPWMRQVFGITTTLAIGIKLFAGNISRLWVTPIGGRMIDKKGSPWVLTVSAVSVIVVALLITLVPGNESMKYLAILLVVLFGIGNTFNRAAMYTPVPEAGIPIEKTGTAMGLVSAIGYSTDIWLYTLCGKWLDNYGNQGYNRIMYLVVGMMALVVVFAYMFKMYLKNKKAKETARI